MIIRNTTAILAAIFLVTIVSKAQASRIDNFCGDRYCGYVEKQEIRHHRHHRHVRKAAHKKIRVKPVKVASIAPKLTSEQKPAGEHSQGLLQKAKSYLGSNPTGWHSLWCARFIAFLAPAVADRLKRMGLNPNWARDYARLDRTRNPKPGDIVVLTRGSGGHIGVLDHFDSRGNPVIVSGNHGHKVGVGTYSKHRVLAYASI